MNEQEIRRQVEQELQATSPVDIETDWITPAGRRRTTPMYEAHIDNSYLNVSKTVKGQSEFDVRNKVREQLNKWAEQEIRGRVADATEDAKARAEEDTALAQEAIQAVRNILLATLEVNDRIDWSTLEDRREYQAMAELTPFAFSTEPAQPVRNLLDWLISSRWQRRLKQWEQEKTQWAEQRSTAELNWESYAKQARIQYAMERQAFQQSQAKHNAALTAYRTAFESGNPEQVEDYLRNVFERSVYPEGFEREYRVAFQPESQTVVVDLQLPNQELLPNVIEHRYNARQRAVTPTLMKAKDHDALYDEAIKQCVLRTIHEVFESVYVPAVQAVVVNGWVTFVDPAFGQDKTTCIITVNSGRQQFEAIKLARIDPTECLKSLKAIIAGPLSQVAPVQPILQFDRNDHRFVAGHDVLDGMVPETNLAEMPWEEFEHLVRELFGKMFAQAGAEVRVTQASSDGGVDAIAFDPDPIRGGKFVIQAKRYTKVVPVSAVRDLFGTMTHENASRGILVTTAHYGRDSRDFAKDKSLTLIDGSNLVYLLEQHGYRVRIDVEEARRNVGRSN